MNFAPSVSQGSLRRLLGLFVLACAWVTPLAHADEYSDVNQLLRSGKYTEALGLYQRIKDKYPSSTEGVTIDKYISRASLLSK